MKRKIQSEYNKHVDVAEDEIRGLSENAGSYSCCNNLICYMIGVLNNYDSIDS